MGINVAAYLLIFFRSTMPSISRWSSTYQTEMLPNATSRYVSVTRLTSYRLSDCLITINFAGMFLLCFCVSAHTDGL